MSARLKSNVVSTDLQNDKYKSIPKYLTYLTYFYFFIFINYNINFFFVYLICSGIKM